ncbi:YbhB/YbcL family Raf kinase inhibitor-like protein [Kitasatospora sp. YST-16]|uniref:YbhB/YbcL family Raf kinase inhibitor-like protein n=1 Tax=unclassified Kitasatospora TaxID=2633591 RepID=UPI0004C2E161|nr:MULTISPECIES: YbhB/YbcL family Raf kinase inhibitor-like protein [unclassified Kitasatospora]WAL76406.1 YbhB/YbcL family Raf kinase inhibitor-like protein [Kitasatospora sp. YST-16]WNW42433.1 YbhB/YbcL family Raf kinase inhibitor-like protein [Streptomyces sp. Li-HN-5-13]
MAARIPLSYDFLPPVPAFEVRSADLVDGGVMPDAQVYGVGNVSPELSWAGAPEGTRSFAVTCYDPDAPTGAGWWHWLAVDLPAETAGLARGAGADDEGLPGGAFHVRNDFPGHRYDGAAPPPGPAHRYVFVVHALDVPTLGVGPDTPAAQVGFNLTAHALGRAVLTVEYQSAP